MCAAVELVLPDDKLRFQLQVRLNDKLSNLSYGRQTGPMARASHYQPMT